MKIPNPSGRMVQECVQRALTVRGREYHVVYICADTYLSLSVMKEFPTGSLTPLKTLALFLRERHIPSGLVVQARMDCGGATDEITTYGPSTGIEPVWEAIPDLYAGLNDTEERQALRATYRRLAKLRSAPSKCLPVEHLERGTDFESLANLWITSQESLAKYIGSWADEQLRFGHIDAVRHQSILSLLPPAAADRQPTG